MSTQDIVTDYNLGSDGDAVYADLIAAHEGLTEADSARLNARLVLLLANHIGSRSVMRDALAVARKGLS